MNNEFMTYYEDYKTKGVGIISDRQSVFEIEKDSKYIHDEKTMELTEKMFPLQKDLSYDKDMIYYFCDGLDLVIYIPNKITYNQYSFISDLLKKTHQYNHKYVHDIKIHAVCENDTVRFDEKTNLNLVLKQLERIKVKKPFFKEKENIIGEVLDDEVIYENVTFMSDLDKANNSNTLKNSFTFLLGLYNDDFYKKYIDHLFPEFYLIKDINYFNWEGIKDKIDKKMISVDTYQDIFEVIIEGVKYSLKDSINYYDTLGKKYESFHDKRYQKEIMDIRKKLENDKGILNRIIEREEKVEKDRMLNEDKELFESNGKRR